MIAIDKTLISEELLEQKFVCDLVACKGACCVKGDAGAPLEDEEASILEDILEEIKPYMEKEGLKAVEKKGVSEIDVDGELTTVLIKGKECAFVRFENGNAKCSIEKAYEEGKINFRKPISCHLYPVRITKSKHYDAVNYDRWEICKPACVCGDKLNVPVYRFLREPLIRKYGEDWYKQLEAAAALYLK